MQIVPIKQETYDILEDQLISHEGLRLKPYKCTSDKLTIGVGRNLEDNGITEDEAKYLLKNDIRNAAEEITMIFPTFYQHNAVRQAVLLNMLFNMGRPVLSRFKNMVAAVETYDYQRASIEMLDSKWARQVKGRAVKLAMMMETGRLK